MHAHARTHSRTHYARTHCARAWHMQFIKDEERFARSYPYPGFDGQKYAALYRHEDRVDTTVGGWVGGCEWCERWERCGGGGRSGVSVGSDGSGMKM